MTQEQVNRLNIAVKPSAEVINEIIKLSKSLAKKYKSEFILDGKNFYPHITVYSPMFPKKNLGKIVEKTKNLVNNFFVINFKALKVVSGQGYIGVEFEYTPEIKKFHESVVEKLNSLREEHYKPEYNALDYKMKISNEKIENIIRYGYPGAMALYHPHMTIIRLKDKIIAEKTATEINWKINNFKSDTIVIYKMGEHGTCIEPVKEFKLKL